MGAGKPYPPDLSEKEGYLVEFDGADDAIHPQNWSMKTKAVITAILSITTFITTFASGIYAPAISTIAADYQVAPEVATLGVTLYVLGFAAGPVVWGPLSEIKGRRLPLVVAAFGTAIFHFAVGVSKDLQSILINRFFAGFFGTSPLAVGGAVFVDLFDNKTRGNAVTIFTISVFIGPMCSPFIGGFIVDSHLGWRWTQYLSGILASTAAVLNFFFIRESYPPVILAKKASEIRRRTKNWAIHAKQEEIEVSFNDMVERNFMRPLRMLVVEPIVLLMRRKLEANGNIPVPEWRLPEAMVGAILFAGGMFWLGWSGYRKDIHWILPTIGGTVTGLGISMVFLQAFNYIIDAYLMLAASALAANTFLRSLFGAIFPLFASYMFKGMGIQWAMTLLGCIALLLAPVPIIFYVKGPQIRKMSEYTPKFPPPGATVESKKAEV
ncbi:mfs transporter, dha1 family, multidrug resistance [Trichoderma arundinaceum]|uniref:Mfs transporter, dha1 family, multidrug resistance n=1 Tax=Trichoderma arundinaceum TaxID=490622 RepID=A0A395NQU9_TRIAR|nr:mfs transporter, dha1 family, multidrug resistance [Trichoderma arundinaceum]